MPRLDPNELTHALELSRCGYAMLLWVSDAVDRGFVSFGAAHDFTTLPEAAAAWVEGHRDNLPPECRPEPDDTDAFSRLFATYLEGSFDLHADTKRQRYSQDAHCFCPICSWLAEAPRLRPKKLTREARSRARKVLESTVRAVALDEQVALSEGDVRALAEDRDLRETLSLVAYGHDLLRRVRGLSIGPAQLALWRGFAWTAEGSPRKGFELDARAILDAEERLRELLRARR